MITRRISYAAYANKNGINRCLKTVKGSYDEENKTIEVMIGLEWAPEYDEVFEAMANGEAMRKYLISQGENATLAQAEGIRSDNMAWMCEALECTETERDAIIAII